MFEKVKEYPVDPIMIGADLFAQDPREDKLNLTVGVYEDENGNTPILEAVKTAERRLADTQGTKAYTALTGDVEYCTTLGETIFGADVYVALRLMADLVAQMPTRPTVWLQTPTYGNYIPILTAAGANWRAVPYYNRAQAEIEFEQMLDGLAEAKPGDLFTCRPNRSPPC
jgi:aspartate/tyrosine/aromatic aminotransferase